MRRVSARRRSALRVETLESRELMTVGDLGLAPFGSDATSNILVRFKANATPAAIGTTLSRFSGSIVKTFQDGPSVVSLGSGVSRAAAVSQLDLSPIVEYAEMNRSIASAAARVTPSDPRFGSQWGLSSNTGYDIGATSAWSVTTGSPSTIVAVIDSGIDTRHPDLVSNLWTNPNEIPGNGVDDDRDGLVDDVNGWNYVTNTGDVTDDDGHGTHVSGIIAAAGNNRVGVAGVAWSAKIMALKFLDSQGDGDTENAVTAIYYAVNHGARVINASWGGSDFSQALRDAIRYAGNRGVVFVTAAGNESVNNDTTPSYPANDRIANQISVAAIDRLGRLADYSNYGARTVDLAAPGTDILSTVPGGYDTYSGTSMAAPFVSGVVALLVGLHPEYSSTQLVSRIVKSTTPVASLVGKTVSGGMLSAARVFAGEKAPNVSGAAANALPTIIGTTLAGTIAGGTVLTPGASSPIDVQATLYSSNEYFQNAGGGTVSGFVDALYRDILGRPSDIPGRAMWAAQLSGGTSRFQVARAILSTGEAYATKVARWYRTDLGRTTSLDLLKKDPGVLSWAGNLLSGTGENTVRAAILSSPEIFNRSGRNATNYVNAIYQLVLGRAGDLGGVAGWANQINRGASRFDIVKGILGSAEAKQTSVARFFIGPLRRTTSLAQLKADAGVQRWASYLTSV